jgi:hypothetical protein
MCVLLDADGRIRKRPVVCGTLYHREMQGLHIPTYPYSDRDANSFSYGNTDGDSYANTNSGPNSDVYSNGHPYSECDSNSHSYSDPNGYPDP